MSKATDTVKEIQADLNGWLAGNGQSLLKVDGNAGPLTQGAFSRLVLASAAPAPAGDDFPEWPYSVKVDGADLIVEGMLTCFGGNGDGTINDPQDKGGTASGVNTKSQRIFGVAIAMNSFYFPAMKSADPAGYLALYGAPFPRIPFRTVAVDVTIEGKTIRAQHGIVDLGPGRNASRPGQPAHVGDLTIPLAGLFNPGWSAAKIASNFEAMGTIRIIGGAQFLPHQS